MPRHPPLLKPPSLPQDRKRPPPLWKPRLRPALAVPARVCDLTASTLAKPPVAARSAARPSLMGAVGLRIGKHPAATVLRRCKHSAFPATSPTALPWPESVKNYASISCQCDNRKPQRARDHRDRATGAAGLLGISSPAYPGYGPRVFYDVPDLSCYCSSSRLPQETARWPCLRPCWKQSPTHPPICWPGFTTRMLLPGFTCWWTAVCGEMWPGYSIWMPSICLRNACSKARRQRNLAKPHRGWSTCRSRNPAKLAACHFIVNSSRGTGRSAPAC